MANASTVRRAVRGIERYGPRRAAGLAVQRSLRPVLAPLAGRRFRAAAAAAVDLEAALDVAFEYEPLGVSLAPGQVRPEIRALLELLREDRPRRMLEIGTASGATLFLFAQVAAPDATLLSVDLPDGEFGGGYPRWRIPVYRAFVRPTQTLHLIRADSHEPHTLARVRHTLGGEQLDFLFIDGDHTFDGVRKDFEDYAPLVRPGGLIAFHDIAPPLAAAPDGRTLLAGDVPEFWRTVRERYESHELIASADGFFGIGVIRVPG